MAIYKYVLHHSANKVPKWFLEAIGVWVSALNKCSYCVDHHYQGLVRLLGDDAKAHAIRAAIDAGDTAAAPLAAKEIAALDYAKALTLDPASVRETMIEGLRSLGYDDGEILEINQVTAYFNYANRTVLGLGCSTEGDVLGLSPNNSANADDWSHT